MFRGMLNLFEIKMIDIWVKGSDYNSIWPPNNCIFWHFFLLYSNVYIWPLKANLPRPYISVLYDEFLHIFKCIIFAKKYYVYKSPCVNFKVTASKSGCMHGTRRNKQNKVYYNDRKHEWLWLILCLLVTIFAIFLGQNNSAIYKNNKRLKI